MKLWKGKRAALSLTFDDALQCQLENAVPAMNDKGITGTFFAIGDCPEYPLDVIGWRRMLPFGHEIGSHSLRHRKAATLTPADAVVETREARRVLNNHFARPIDSYCYPYTDAPAPLQAAVRAAGYAQARGGRVARTDKYVLPGDGVNLLNVPCFHVSNASFENGDMRKWLEELIDRQAWLTLMFHAVGDNNGWDNVTVPEFYKFMELLQVLQMRDMLWVAPFGTAAACLRENQ